MSTTPSTTPGSYTAPAGGGAGIGDVRAAMDAASAQANELMIMNIEFQSKQRIFDAVNNVSNKVGAQGQSIAR